MLCSRENIRHKKNCIHHVIIQPEGLDADADAEVDRIVSEITGGVLSSAIAAPSAAVKGKGIAAPAEPEPEPEVKTAEKRLPTLKSLFD